MTDDIEMRRRRAAYRAAHRGTREMDIVLGRFAEAHVAGMSGAELSQFERLLGVPDPQIAQWFSHGGAEAEFAGLVAALRSFHGLAANVEGELEA
jgi:antitoxin CptB